MKNLSRPVAVVLLIAATLFVYWPALRNGFVWDDTALVLRDPMIRSWRLIPEGFRHFLFLDATASNFYRPLQRLTFTADYALYGFGAPWGWHLSSICVHAAAAVALFFLGQKLIGGTWGPFGAALFWAVHPMFTSAVTYVAGRADPLAALFGFSALALAVGTLDRPHTWLTTLAASLCFLAALLSKEAGIIALPIWFAALAWRRASLRVFGKWIAIGVVVIGAYLGLRLTAERNPPPAPPATPLPVRPILAARAFAEYAGVLVWPARLHMERDVTTVPQATPEATLRNARVREYQTLFGVLLVLGFLVWARREWRLRSPAFLCLVAFVIAYLPISNLFSLNATVAEHWLYVPAAFLFLAIASIGGPPAPWPAGRRPYTSALFAVAAVVALGVRTWRQQDYWHDPRQFFEQTIARGGDTARMHINIGNLESGAGHHEAALAQFRIAVERTPEQPMAWFGLANAAIRARDFATAHAALDKVPASPMLAGDLLQTRAILEHLETGRDTGDLLRQAIEAAPRNWGVRKRHLEHLDERGETAQAARELRDFLGHEAFRSESWLVLGGFLEKLHQPPAAIAAFEEAAALDVRDANSRARLAALGAANH